jgi:hypothetical protein
MMKSAIGILALMIWPVAPALPQSADVTGWRGLLWGTKKPVVLKALQSLHIRECPPAPATPCAGGMFIDALRLNSVTYSVGLFFSPASGLNNVTMTASDEKGAFDRVLGELTGLYGKPELQSAYDGDQEDLETTWIWAKLHGQVSLAPADGAFTITYDARPERSSK